MNQVDRDLMPENIPKKTTLLKSNSKIRNTSTTVAPPIKHCERTRIIAQYKYCLEVPQGSSYIAFVYNGISKIVLRKRE